MFWKRSTGHGAFAGLLAGTGAASLTHGLTVAEGKGGWIANVHQFPSTMAQNFWIAIIAWSTCFLVTVLVSLATRPKPVSELKNLVYGETDPPPAGKQRWFERPAALAVAAAALCIFLNVWFR
jgi:SSS family solute:Na+ symporter